MKNFIVAFALLTLSACSSQASKDVSVNTPIQPALTTDPDHICEPCDYWNTPREPFHVFGSTYYVGTKGLSAILIAGDAGHILLDGGLPQSAPLISANIEALGFHMRDIKIIANSHAHYDHAGGIAALQRVSGAKVLACPRGAETLRTGISPTDDPQYTFGPDHTSFPAIKNTYALKDGHSVTLGSLKLTAHCTPGHTPGAASWSWQDCENGQCEDIVYADSLSAVSSDDFKFSDTPNRVEVFKNSIDKMAALPCSILFVTHPEFTDIDGKLKRRAADPTLNPFINSGDCQTYPIAKHKQLQARLKTERTQAP